MKKIILDGNYLCNREVAHTYLQEKLELPDYYGKNLDALYDCLTELRDIHIEIKQPKEANDYFRRVLRIFQGAEMEGESFIVDVK